MVPIFGIAGLASAASAQPDDDDPPPAGEDTADAPPETTAIEKPRELREGEVVTVEHEWTAADVIGAPVPGQESGRLDRDPGDSTVRTVTRAVLLLPRALFELAFQPVRGGIYVVERLKLPQRYYSYFYNEEGTFGITPWAWLDTGEGFSFGGQLYWGRNGDAVRGFAGTGGSYRQLYSLSLRSRELAGRVSLRLDGEYRDRTNAPFYGIGNGDEISAPDMPIVPRIDPLIDDTSVETRFRKRTARAWFAADVRAVADLHARGAVTFSDVDMGSGSRDLSIEDAYVPQDLIGFDDGYRSRYGELELRWDGRRAASIWEARRAAPVGWQAAAFAGWTSIEDGDSFWRYGADLQYALRIAPGPRTLIARLYGEGVTAELDQLPFTELPVLGGGKVLRGYAVDRFRDRVALFGTLEYDWDLSRTLISSLFVDVGRVYPDLSDITADELRYGFGLALEAHRYRSFVARASLETSIDGGVFVRLAFDSPFNPRRREQYR